MFWGKTIVYIDNSNIYRGGKDTGWLPEYEKLMRFLEKLGGNLWDVHFFAIEEREPPRAISSTICRKDSDLLFTSTPMDLNLSDVSIVDGSVSLL